MRAACMRAVRPKTVTCDRDRFLPSLAAGRDMFAIPNPTVLLLELVRLSLELIDSQRSGRQSLTGRSASQRVCQVLNQLSVAATNKQLSDVTGSPRSRSGVIDGRRPSSRKTQRLGLALRKQLVGTCSKQPALKEQVRMWILMLVVIVVLLFLCVLAHWGNGPGCWSHSFLVTGSFFQLLEKSVWRPPNRRF